MKNIHTMDDLHTIRADMRKASHPEKAQFLQRFFKTGKGEYGEGDVFLGLTVPQSRIIAQKYKNITLVDIEKLLASKIHEERLIAIFILVAQFKKGDAKTRRQIFDFYVNHTKFINNWDLVDSSAGYIVGTYLLDRPTGILKKLARSEHLWERRIAIIATLAFITQGRYQETFSIAEMLLHDKHDLIHKAVGWMLREVGKRVSRQTEEEFLKKYYQTMPRTMLRYAIEHFPEPRRKKYLTGNIV